MGIYDREYYRREGPSFLGSIAERGKVCKWLIAINVAFFVVQMFSAKVTDWLDDRTGAPMRVPSEEEIGRQLGPELHGLSPEEKREAITETRQEWEQQAEQHSRPGVLQGQVWRLLTYAFLHDSQSLWHILFNMLFLWWFGHEMEELYGAREFLTFYLVAAFCGGLAFFLWQWSQGDPTPCVGASGAVMAVLVLYAFHYPRRVIYVFMLLPVPIWLFVLFYVAQDAFVFTSKMHTQTAVTVHLAGALFGFLYYKGNWRLAPIWQSLAQFRLPRRRPRVRIYDEEPTPPRRPRPSATASGGTATASPPAVDEHLEAQVDAVLEKVQRSGRDSLTESEKALLVRASELYKRRQQP